MCFSAGASFGASVLLGAIGAIAIAKAKTKPQKLFAAIPLVFAVQQFSEGMLWLSLQNTGNTQSQSFYTYIFLVFAMMVWPVWIPLTIRLPEKDFLRKKIITALLVTGIFIAAGIGCLLLLYPVQVIGRHHHLHYEFYLPPVLLKYGWIFSLLYFLPTIITPFISSIKKMKWLGVVFIASYLFAVIFYNGFVISVWCYFAALLSIVVLWIMWDSKKNG
jgi:hypothetical protein